MIAIPSLLRPVALILSGMLMLACGAGAAEIKVVSSGGFAPAYRDLASQFEASSGIKLVTGWGPSMGDTQDAIPNRLLRGEPIDVVIMVGAALDELVKQGKVIADSRVALANSTIGMVVRAGAPKPDISTIEALKATLLSAKSIVYSDSASGVYLSKVLFPKLGVAEAIKDKARMIPADPVAGVVARGDAEIGFQQISELLPVPGADLVGPLPAEAQQVTLYAAGVVSGAAHAEAGKSLIRFLASAEAAPIITRSGLEPLGGH